MALTYKIIKKSYPEDKNEDFISDLANLRVKDREKHLGDKTKRRAIEDEKREFRGQLSHNIHYLVAYDGKKLAGFIEFSVSKGEIRTSYTLVDRDLRNIKIASKLSARLIAIARRGEKFGRKTPLTIIRNMQDGYLLKIAGKQQQRKLYTTKAGRKTHVGRPEFMEVWGANVRIRPKTWEKKKLSRSRRK